MEIQTDQMNDFVKKIITMKNKLAEINYNDPQYDDLEESLHIVEDEFQESFGDYLEEIIGDIHDEYCPDNELLLPIAYFANQYKASTNEKGEALCNIDDKGGVIIETEEYPDEEVRLVIFADPVRLVIFKSDEDQKVVWQATE